MNMRLGRYIAVIGVGLMLGVGAFYAIDPIAPARAQELSAEERASLQAQYDQLQKEIEEYQKIINETKAKASTIQGDVTILDTQVKKAQAEINQRTSSINTLASTINQKSKAIATLESRLEDGRASLAKLLREKSYGDNTSLVVLALSGGTLTDFFANADRIDAIDQGLQDKFNELRGVKTQTQSEKEALAKQQSAQLDAKHEVEVKKTVITQSKTEKTNLLNATKQDEAAYNQVLADRKAKAAQIQARLFPLRDTASIKFGDAVAYAKVSAAKTGVRPVLVLAILSQESSIGANVGNCYVTNLATGDGINKNTGAAISGVMKAPRDTVPFERITKALGKDPATTPISCPQGAGYGGAMGPTQFIPSTWEMFAPRIMSSLGVPASNPWNAQHAIMATALYLMDSGAGAQTYSAERNAACRYFSGSACPNTGGWIDGYANSVVAKADAYQKDVEVLADL